MTPNYLGSSQTIKSSMIGSSVNHGARANSVTTGYNLTGWMVDHMVEVDIETFTFNRKGNV